ncbi:Gustatory receptor 20, partial [Hyalella azteca]
MQEVRQLLKECPEFDVMGVFAMTRARLLD